MEDLIQRMLSFPPHPAPPMPLSDHAYEEGVKSQISMMKAVSDSKLLQPTSGGEGLLDVVNPSLNTVPYTYILLAHLKAMQKNTKGLTTEFVWNKCAIFLNSFDPRQGRYLGQELTQIIEAVAFYARRAQQPHIAIPSIRDAILKLQPSGTVLTSAHLTIVHLTLESRAFALALPVLDKFILYFPGTSNQPKPKYLCDMSLPLNAYITTQSNLTNKLKPFDVLEYFLYSGMIYIGMRDWVSARNCLENAITYPSRGDTPISKLMVEAYKKWVLVGVLLEGRLLPMPKWTGSIAAKQYHILAKPYEVVAQLFESATASRFKAEIDAGTRIWHEDFNVGLILTLLSAFQEFQIKNLGKIYGKISIPEIQNQTQSAETGGKLPNVQLLETLVRDMITSKKLRATLSNHSPPVLTFDSAGPVRSETEMQRELADATHRIGLLSKEIELTNRVLTHDKDYIKFHQKYVKNKDAGKGPSFSDIPIEWKDDEDEDLMAPGY